MKKNIFLIAIFTILSGVLLVLLGQESSVVVKIVSSQKPTIAIPDFRGSGAAQSPMGAFNETLFNDLQNSGLFTLASKSMYPLQVPQRPEDFRQAARPGASAGGLALSDWASPPVSANFLATGYTADQN